MNSGTIVRRPRVDYESHAVALDRNELGALLVAAGLGSPVEHALISLLALNGLRVSEATGADSRLVLGWQRRPEQLICAGARLTSRRRCSAALSVPGSGVGCLTCGPRAGW